MAIYQDFIELFKQSAKERNLLKLSLGDYKGDEVGLKKVIVKLVEIKREIMFSCIYRYQTKDITKNYSLQEGLDLLIDMVHFSSFRSVSLQTENKNLEMRIVKKAGWIGSVRDREVSSKVNFSHDKTKVRKLTELSSSYLHELKLTDEKGKVYKNAQDKWKQINHYIEILSASLKGLPDNRSIEIVDMGAGKGYLTFALYDYLKNQLNKDVSVVGVEYRDDLVKLCNQIAEKASFENLKFEQGTIVDYQSENSTDVLIALHACDTATDDAIFKGITDRASLIVVAPCCHKQVRRELDRVKANNDLSFMVKYGIFMERHSEMLTDSIRALILNYFGYETKVIQFISDQHTPKNVMIIAEKKEINKSKQLQILNELKDIKSYFGLTYHHLERLCGLND